MINIIGLLLIYKINGYLASSYHIHRDLQLKIAVCTILTVCFMWHRVFSNVYTRKCISCASAVDVGGAGPSKLIRVRHYTGEYSELQR